MRPKAEWAIDSEAMRGIIVKYYFKFGNNTSVTKQQTSEWRTHDIYPIYI